MTDSPGNGYLVNSGYQSSTPSTNSLETWRSNTKNAYQAGAPKQPNVGEPRFQAFDAGAGGSWEYPHTTPTGQGTGAAQGNSALDQNLADSQDAAASAARSGLNSVRQPIPGRTTDSYKNPTYDADDDPGHYTDSWSAKDAWSN